MVWVQPHYPEERNANSILKLLSGTVIDLRMRVRAEDPGMQVVLLAEHPIPYDHASNGLAQSAVEIVTELLRTLTRFLENAF